MFEHRRQGLLPRRQFIRRQLGWTGWAASVVAVSLAIGTAGYMYFGGLALVDGFLNASMILTGMGPIDRMEGDGAKLFAACYALYSGVAFLTTIAVFLAPVVHRFLHKLHLRDPEEG
ncbi:MAG: hypothetical protein H6597_06640 [Flavobacteriales bacterium]|nr:hypothetical protein [Flavobacteriales bacterium]MCB9194194.1 hypothetical protein [Flavobacteriales bacterium]